ncbi:hypothetical protein STEG23_001818 [Scotinomys teguina]
MINIMLNGFSMGLGTKVKYVFPYILLVFKVHYCEEYMSVEGLHAIVVSDRDGVPVIKVANDSAPEHALRPGFLSTFALATDQGSKLGLSKNKSIICYYNTYQEQPEPPTYCCLVTHLKLGCDDSDLGQDVRQLKSKDLSLRESKQTLHLALCSESGSTWKWKLGRFHQRGAASKFLSRWLVLPAVFRESVNSIQLPTTVHCVFVFRGNPLVTFSSEACHRSEHLEHSTLPEPRKFYLKMNDRDRTVSSPWSSCFLIFDCNET